MKFFEIAKFEYKKIIKKPSFWASTLFLPIFIGIVGLVSGYSSMDAMKKMENMEIFSKIYIVDELDLIDTQNLGQNLFEIDNLDEVKDSLLEDSKSILIVIPDNFLESLRYEVYFSEEGDILRGANVALIVDSLLKNSAIQGIDNESSRILLTSQFNSTVFSITDDGKLQEEGLEKFVLPIISLVLFFVTVFISSSFLLQSVSAEKENRMIETMLSIVDKKSLMIGKMVGLICVVFTQLVIWLLFGILIYYLAMSKFDIPIPIDIKAIDLQYLPINLFFIIMGFLFFASVMTGVGAVGTGAEDSRNLSSIFIILSIFPMYLMQSLITEPNSLLAKIFSYFPFTSFMILLTRNSLGVLSVEELIIGIFTSIIYVAIAIFLASKLFELGCLMYNRRPTFAEIVKYFR
ncbi:MAG: ABC transporter permease [Candidatus Dojkabacteria bacterium]|nr:ABC transporter permease [Candidatus Dojkabacteria bacterium]